MIRQVKITVPVSEINLEVTVTYKRIRDTEFWEAFIGLTSFGIYHTDLVGIKLSAELVGRM